MKNANNNYKLAITHPDAGTVEKSGIERLNRYRAFKFDEQTVNNRVLRLNIPKRKARKTIRDDIYKSLYHANNSNQAAVS